jgi:ribonuclease-3
MNDFSEFIPQLESVEAALEIVFNNKEVLFRSLVHDSFVYENEEIKRSNERLEFLGDSVLGLIISHLIYSRYPNWQEGDLALLKSSLVSSESLAERAREIELGTYLFLGKGEDASGGRQRASILSDALEALIGAIFLDQGFDTAYSFVEKIFNECLDVKTPLKDFKSYLQEYSQKHFKALPNYNVVDEIGPPHRKVFKVKVEVGSVHNGEGEGTSKKEAEQSAAKNLLDKITGTF